MSLVETIRNQIKDAMRAKRTIEKDVLRSALGEVQIAESRTGIALDEEGVQKIVRKLIKSNHETLAVATDDAMKAKLTRENEVLDALLPSRLTRAEIEQALAPVRDAIVAAKSDGQATGVAMKTLKTSGAAVDGKDVAAAVKAMRSPAEP